MKKKNWFYAIALAAPLLWAACDDDDDPTRPQLSDGDEEFVEWAADANLAEIEFGQLAVTKGTDPLVRDFGQQMIDDHEMAQNELEAFNNDYRDIDWPDDMDDDHQDMYDQLEDAEGARFDSMYMRSQMNMHQAAIHQYETANTNADESRVRNYAGKHLPALEEHHERADSIFTVLMTRADEGTEGTADGTGDGTTEGTDDGTTGDGTADGGTDDGTTGDGTTDGGTDDGTTGDGTADGGTDDGTTGDGTTDGGTDDGTTGDGTTDGGTTGDGTGGN